MSQGFCSGDRVNLMIGQGIVAVGTVHAVCPTDTCHGQILGDEFLSVSIDKCIDVAAHLPFPTSEAMKVIEAIGTFVKWEKKDVVLETNSMIIVHHDHVETRYKDENLMGDEDIASIRESWKERKVMLWTQGNMKCIGSGIILLTFPYDVINFELLGEEDVGVVIDHILDAGTGADKCDMLHCINLVKWPIKQITFEDGTPLLHEHSTKAFKCARESIKDMHETDEEFVSGQKSFFVQKRSYCMINRKPRVMALKSSNSRTSVDSVLHVSTIDCCPEKCCQLADRDAIHQLRKYFWGLHLEERTNYVYDILESSCHIGSMGTRKYTFLFNGKAICNRAWYGIHGIPKTSFYRYKVQFEHGVRRAMHGNKGAIRAAWDHTQMGRAILRDFVEKNAEQMPHKSRTMQDGSRETQLVIPDVYKQVDIWEEVNATLEAVGCKQMSLSTFNRIWNTEFKHVTLAKTSEFSKCSICSEIKDQLAATKCLEERNVLLRKRRSHMLQQQSCRNIYYGWRLASVLNPEKNLCIIHDKMDQQKTAIPRLRVRSKETDRSTQLPISLTGMITHGHGQGRYGHFAIDLWPHDPNFTVASLSLCFKNLEQLERHEFGDLQLDGMPRSSSLLLNALNSRKALDLHHQGLHTTPHMEDTAIQEGQQGFKRLPENLLLQLDNCGSENKNRFLFAYLSLLVARGTFKMIQVGFLMVGHTHEDIDAMFSKFSEKLRTSMTFTFPHLMQHFQLCQSTRPAPFLLTHVPDFKSYIEGFLCDSKDTLVGHSKPLHFRFYMQGDIPLMQYKMHPKSIEWLPREGGIELWKRDSTGKPTLPKGLPTLLPMFEYIKDHQEVICGIKDYLKYWERWTIVQGPEADYTKFITPVIEYWKTMINSLQTSNVQEDTLFMDFWPKTQGDTTFQDADDVDDFLGLEELNDHYCGPLSKRPKDAFQPMVDVKKGDFVLVRPADSIYPIWLGVAQSEVDTDKHSSNYKRICIQYWAPVSSRQNITDEEVYHNCWEKYWMCNKKDPERWETVDTIVFSWITKATKIPKKIKIPPKVVFKAKASLQESFG